MGIFERYDLARFPMSLPVGVFSRRFNTLVIIHRSSALAVHHKGPSDGIECALVQLAHIESIHHLPRRFLLHLDAAVGTI